MDRSLPGSSVHGILQAKTLEQVAISSSISSSQGSTLRLLHWQADSSLLPTQGSPDVCVYVTESPHCMPEAQHCKSATRQDGLQIF